MTQLKEQLERRISISLKTSPSAIILNWGHYGSGKTHAAKYFTHPETLAALTALAGLHTSPLPLAFYVGFPRVDKGAAFNLTSSIIGQLGVAAFAQKLQEAKAKLDAVDTQLFFKLLWDYCNDTELQKILCKLAQTESADHDKIGRVLFGNSSTADLRDLQIARKPDSVADISRILATALNLFTYRSSDVSPLHPTIHIWIDEFEDIASLSGKEQDALAAYIRNLIDLCPRHVNIFMNFTLTPVQGIQDLGLFLGEAVTSRIRQRLEFAEPTKPEMKVYIREMLNATGVRQQESRTGDLFAPFEEEAIDFILDTVSPRTPRRVNEILSFYLDMAAGTANMDRISESTIREYAVDVGLNI